MGEKSVLELGTLYTVALQRRRFAAESNLPWNRRRPQLGRNGSRSQSAIHLPRHEGCSCNWLYSEESEIHSRQRGNRVTVRACRGAQHHTSLEKYTWRHGRTMAVRQSTVVRSDC